MSDKPEEEGVKVDTNGTLFRLCAAIAAIVLLAKFTPLLSLLEGFLMFVLILIGFFVALTGGGQAGYNLVKETISLAIEKAKDKALGENNKPTDPTNPSNWTGI